MSVSLWQDLHLRQKKEHEFDVAVIGAGIAGLSAAYWLKKYDPDLKVAVIEKYEMGSGATGRNAGFITCGSVEHYNRLVEKHGAHEASEIWRFSEENLELLKKEVIGEDAKGLMFDQKGSFSLASTEHEFSELKKSAELMKEHGIQVEVMDQKDVLSRLGAKGFVGGIKYLGDASIHPMLLLEKIRCQLKGVEFFENNEVYAVENSQADKLIKTSKGRFKSSLVVFATNGYSPLLHPYFADKIYPTRGQILAVEAADIFMEGPCYANFVLDYFRQIPTGELVIGGFRQLKKDAEVGYSDETSEEIQEALECFVKKHLPNLKDKKITHRWSGIMGFSADGQPLVGSMPSDPQMYFLGGFTAHGLGLAFHCGKVLAQMVCDENYQAPGFLNARRFS